MSKGAMLRTFMGNRKKLHLSRPPGEMGPHEAQGWGWGVVAENMGLALGWAAVFLLYKQQGGMGSFPGREWGAF